MSNPTVDDAISRYVTAPQGEDEERLQTDLIMVLNTELGDPMEVGKLLLKAQETRSSIQRQPGEEASGATAERSEVATTTGLFNEQETAAGLPRIYSWYLGNIPEKEDATDPGYHRALERELNKIATGLPNSVEYYLELLIKHGERKANELKGGHDDPSPAPTTHPASEPEPIDHTSSAPAAVPPATSTGSMTDRRPRDASKHPEVVELVTTALDGTPSEWDELPQLLVDLGYRRDLASAQTLATEIKTKAEAKNTPAAPPSRGLVLPQLHLSRGTKALLFGAVFFALTFGVCLAIYVTGQFDPQVVAPPGQVAPTVEIARNDVLWEAFQTAFLIGMSAGISVYAFSKEG